MELVAKANQDTYLTGNPQITFIKSIYKRHTNFSVETIEEPLPSQIDFGAKNAQCIISRKGDLINKMYLKVTLPSATSLIQSTNSTYANWVNNIGHALIKEVRFLIGSTKIDSHISEWFDVWNELTDVNHDEWDLIGKKVDKRELKIKQSNKTEYYIPLRFWFTKNIGLSLPLIALQYQEIKLQFDIRQLSELITTDGTNVTSIGTLDDIRLFIDYIYLDEPERTQVAQSSHEYLIEQLQFQKFDDIGQGHNEINLEFYHPIKELIWVFRHKKRIDETNTPALNLKQSDINGNDIFNYSGTTINTTLGLNTYDIFSSSTIELNGQERFSPKDPIYFRRYQPYIHHSKLPEKHIYVYSFAIDTEKYQPSGTCNFSAISTKKLIFNDILSSDFELLVFSVNYNILNIESGTGNLLFMN